MVAWRFSQTWGKILGLMWTYEANDRREAMQMGRRHTLEDLEDATRHVTNEIQEVLESRRTRPFGSVLRNHFMYL